MAVEKEEKKLAAQPKKLKYQALIDSKGIKAPCPSKGCKEMEKDNAYRWGHSPKENELNFLTNFDYNERKGMAPMRFNDNDDLKKCGYCSLSLFDDIESAKNVWFADSKFMERIRKSLGYTHILKGCIKKEMGVATQDAPHFELFEYEGVELRNDFEVFCELIKE